MVAVGWDGSAARESGTSLPPRRRRRTPGRRAAAPPGIAVLGSANEVTAVPSFPIRMAPRSPGTGGPDTTGSTWPTPCPETTFPHPAEGYLRVPGTPPTSGTNYPGRRDAATTGGDPDQRTDARELGLRRDVPR